MELKFFHDINNERLCAAWKEMEAQASPFLYYDYVKYVWLHTSRFSAYMPRIAYVESRPHGKILMIVPLRWNIYKRCYKMLTDIQGCGKADALFDLQLSEEAKHTCVDFFYAHIGHKCYFRRLPSEALLRDDINGIKLDNKQQICVKIDFDCGVENLLHSLHKSVRQNVRTAYNRLNKDNIGVELKVYRGSQMTDSVWRQIMDIYLDRLFSKYKTKAKRNTIQKFIHYWKYRYIKHDTQSLRHLSNSFHAVLVGNGDIMAFLSGFMSMDDTTLVVPRLAINDSYHFYSPGYLLIVETLRYLEHETHCRCLDLSRGDERYKTDLGGTNYYTESLTFSTPY